jgi:hypothetical protein
MRAGVRAVTRALAQAEKVSDTPCVSHGWTRTEVITRGSAL